MSFAKPKIPIKHFFYKSIVKGKNRTIVINNIMKIVNRQAHSARKINGSYIGVTAVKIDYNDIINNSYFIYENNLNIKYNVIINGNTLDIYEPIKQNKDITKIELKLLKSVKCLHYIIGISNDARLYGNTILAEIKKGTYLHIGRVLEEFTTTDTIRVLVSYYNKKKFFPYAIGDKYTLLLNDDYENILNSKCTTQDPYLQIDKPIKNFYLTHDNGGRPFKVVIKKGEKKIEIHKNVTTDEEYDAMDPCSCNISSYKWKLHSTHKYEKIFIGSDDEQKADFYGNSILIQTALNTYICICINVFEFKTTDEIIKFVSPVWNNDVTYPYAIGKENIYDFINFKKIPINKCIIFEPCMQGFGHAFSDQLNDYIEAVHDKKQESRLGITNIKTKILIKRD